MERKLQQISQQSVPPLDWIIVQLQKNVSLRISIRGKRLFCV
jgi:hypothetical protein